MPSPLGRAAACKLKTIRVNDLLGKTFAAASLMRKVAVWTNEKSCHLDFEQIPNKRLTCKTDALQKNAVDFLPELLQPFARVEDMVCLSDGSLQLPAVGAAFAAVSFAVKHRLGLRDQRRASENEVRGWFPSMSLRSKDELQLTPACQSN